MASYTNVYMAAIMPECRALPSVGSVAANFARTSIDESRNGSRRYSDGSGLVSFLFPTKYPITSWLLMMVGLTFDMNR